MSTIESFFLSDPGQKRTNNEDAVGAVEPTDIRQLNQSGRLYVVADGLGGHQMGEKASDFAVKSLLKIYFETPEIQPEKRLRDIIQQVNQELIDYSQKNLAPGEKMATTVVAAVVRENSLLVANVGDSRAYLVRNGEIRQLTRDHSYIGEMVRAGALTEEEAQQSRFRNRLTRSVGGGEANLEADVSSHITLYPGDVILLCTDGLTQYASPRDILAVAAHGTTRQIVEDLINFANEHGGSDNISVMAIKIGGKKAIAIPSINNSLKLRVARMVAAFVFGVIAMAGITIMSGIGISILTTNVTPTSPAVEFTQALESPALTSLPELMATPPITQTPMTEPPPLDCRYIVQDGDIASILAEEFAVPLTSFYRENGAQDDFNSIQSGEVLIIRGVDPETCENNSGIPNPATTNTPADSN